MNFTFLKKTLWVSCMSLGLLMTLLSDRSGYSLKTDVDSMNWDIALMLSPAGLARAYVIEPDFYLRPYYGEASERGELFRDPILLFVIVGVGLSAVSGLVIYREIRLRAERNFRVGAE